MASFRYWYKIVYSHVNVYVYIFIVFRPVFAGIELRGMV